VQEASAYPVLFDATNTNLSLSQKEVLLWHQRLLHASIKWIQCLIRDRKWLQDNANKGSLHDGLFLLCKNSHASSCSVSALKCAACLCAKASTRSPTNTPTQPALRNHHFQDELNTTKPKILKRGHLEPGDCISIDQYASKVQARLLLHLVVNDMVIRMGLCSLTMLAGKYLTSVNCQTMILKPSPPSLVWKLSLGKSQSQSRNSVLTMASLPHPLSKRIIIQKGRSSPLAELAPITKMVLLNGTSRPYLNGRAQACCTHLILDQTLPASICGPKQLTTPSGCSTTSLQLMLALVQMNSGRAQDFPPTVSTARMSLGVPYMSSTHDCKMGIKFQNGTLAHASGCLLVSLHCILCWFLSY
jgi:hypothetical protein